MSSSLKLVKNLKEGDFQKGDLVEVFVEGKHSNVEWGAIGTYFPLRKDFFTLFVLKAKGFWNKDWEGLFFTVRDKKCSWEIEKLSK